MSYYESIEEEFNVSHYLVSYKNDFIKYDKEILAKKEFNSFILAFRKTGTNLCIFKENKDGQDKDFMKVVKDIQKHLLKLNDRFIYGKNGLVIEIVKDRVREIILSEIRVNQSDYFLYC